ncbi:MAG: hypothetical protein AB4290_26025 [Spirulina sp.]
MTVYIGNFPQKYLQNIFGEYGGEESSVNQSGDDRDRKFSSQRDRD